jgi:hypothetical protein
MIRYSRNKELDILITNTTGITVLGDILQHYQELNKIKDLPRNLKNLIDCREAIFELNVEDLNKTKPLVKDSLKWFDSIKEAILVNQPSSTAIAMMFQDFNNSHSNYEFKIFSTKSAALDWLTSFDV